MCDDNRIKGQLYGIGLGPGDPELLTVKAVKLLQNAHRIIIPKARIKTESVARDIVSRAIGEDLPFYELIFPMSRDKDELEKHWNAAAETVLSFLEKGEDVAFVTLGDVSLYSTFSYLERALAEKNPTVAVELVPGISSIQLAAVRFKTPMALGDENYGVFPLPENLSDLGKMIEDHDSLMIMKIGSRLGELREYLLNKDLADCVKFIRRGGFPDEYLCENISMLKDHESGYLSIMMVKKEGFI